MGVVWMLTGERRIPPPPPTHTSTHTLHTRTHAVGPLLRSYVAHLTGADLSPGMIAKAKARGCYDELAVADLLEFLKSNSCGANAFGLWAIAQALSAPHPHLHKH